ncbi:MAG: YwaF family protein [Tenericutes bacterium]|nr:YwaF family protein [Mycoplasmatota bacterium]
MLLLAFFTTSGMDEHPGAYFFGTPHLIYFLLNIVLFIILWKLLKTISKKNQDKLITVFLILILLLKYAGDILFIYEYYYVSPALSSYPHPLLDVDTIISFQLCGITNILLPLTIWFKIKPLKEFVYLSSIMGGIAVVVYPVTILYGDPFTITLPMVRSTLVHFFLIFIPLFLINRGDVKLNPKNWRQIAIGFGALLLWATFGNYVIDIGDNNLYLFENPFLQTDIPLLSLIPNGWHILALVLIFGGAYFFTYKICKWFEPNVFRNKIKKLKKA